MSCSEAIQTRAPFTIEKRYVRPGGAEVWGNNHVAIVCDEAGAASYVAAISLDITDRTRIERELLEREQLHDVVVDRELRMMEIENENAALREELVRLTGVPHASDGRS